MDNFKQLTPSFPNVVAFVNAYSCGKTPYLLTAHKQHGLNINGKSDQIFEGELMIGFQHGSENFYRVPGVGFIYDDSKLCAKLV